MSIAPQPQVPQPLPDTPQEAAPKKSNKALLIVTIFFVLVAIGTSILAGPRVYDLVNKYSEQNSLTTKAEEAKKSVKESKSKLTELKNSSEYQEAMDGARLWCSTGDDLNFEDAESWDADLNPIQLNAINELCPEQVARWKVTEELHANITANLKVKSCDVSFGSLLINGSLTVEKPEGMDDAELTSDTIIVTLKGSAVEGSVVASDELPVFLDFGKEEDFTIFVPLGSKKASRCTVEPVSWLP